MQNFTVTLSQEQWNVIGAALGELPFRVASPIVVELNKQFVDQATQDEVDPHKTEDGASQTA